MQHLSDGKRHIVIRNTSSGNNNSKNNNNNTKNRNSNSSHGTSSHKSSQLSEALPHQQNRNCFMDRLIS